MRSISKYLHRQWIARPLAVFSVCFLLGVLAGNAFSIPLIPAILLPVIPLAIHFILKRKYGIRWYILPMMAAFLLGNARMTVAFRLNPSVPDLFSVNYSGIVVSDPYYNESTERIICRLHVDEVDGVSVRYDVKLYLRSDEIELTGIEYGQRLDCFGHIWPEDPATNPHEYDGLNGLRADGLDGMAAAKLEDVIIHPPGISLSRLRIGVQHAIKARIHLLFPDNPELIIAFVLGDRNGLDQEIRNSFRETGVSHLICISGLHVTTLAAAISKLLSLRFSRRESVLTTLCAIIVYGFLISFSPSLVRATVMFAIYSFVPVVGRPSDPITRLGTALLVMLLFKPFCIFDGGFVLSYSAAAGIMLLTEPLEYLFHVDSLRGMKPHPRRVFRLVQKFIKYFPQLFCTTLAAQLATLPAIIAYFGIQSLLSIPANLLVIPIAMTAYPLSLVALILSVVFVPLGQLFAMLPDYLFSLLIIVVRTFAALPAHGLHVPAYPIWLEAIHSLIILLASGLNRISIRIRRFMVLLLAGLVGISIFVAWTDTLGFKVVFLDAGQADAAVIKAEGQVYLCDTGDLYSPAADYVSASCLGVDAVFLSHPHYDHAAGLTELVEKLPPKAVYVPAGWFDEEIADSVAAAMDAVTQAGIPIIELIPGDELHPSENVTIRVHQSTDPSASENDRSMILEVEYLGRSILFTGDVTSECEPSDLPDVDVLKVAHHGSKAATSQRLLCQTTPQVAVISVGENNYGHPADETLQRLYSSGADVYRTDQCGAIEIRFSKNGEIEVQTYLPMEENPNDVE